MMKMRAATAAILMSVLVLSLATACSRERMEWRSAEAADTIEGYDHFIGRHPDSVLATQARARMVQLTEERDWRRASTADTRVAYKLFLSQHENGKWAEEARIRIENFALDAGPPPDAAVPARDGAAMALPAAAAVAPASPLATSLSVTSPASASPAAQSAPSFGIQLGAFSTQPAALGEWQRLQERFGSELNGLLGRPVPVQTASGRLFRLQANVGEETRARAICASLEKKSQPCVVVLP